MRNYANLLVAYTYGLRSGEEFGLKTRDYVTRSGSARSDIVRQLDLAMGLALAPFAQAFMGKIIRSENVLGRFPVQSGDTFAFSPDGSMLAVAERGSAEGHASKRWIAVAVHVFRLSDGTEVARREQPRDASATSLAWDPSGRFLAYLDGDTMHLWKPPAREATDVTIRLKSEIVGGIAISADGNRMAVGDGYAIDVFRIGP